MNSETVISTLKKLSDREIAKHSQRYFKTGKGEYGYGDIFLGIRVPVLRKQVSQFREISITEIKKLIRSRYHEIRLFALLLLVKKFSMKDVGRQEKIYNLYLQHTKYINNWDLVDTSAPSIVGQWLFDKDRTILYELAKSDMLWERRISMISTGWFIKNEQYRDTLQISDILINDPEDLIHKAAGWMLREIGNRDRSVEEKYLKSRYKKMPRIMLRYAIEKFKPELRQRYLKSRV